MKKSNTSKLFCAACAILLTANTLFAIAEPDGKLGRYGLKKPDTNNALGINANAMNSAFDVKPRDFGIDGESSTNARVSYECNLTYSGKKVANNATAFTFEDRRELFSGESYTELSYLYALDKGYANTFFALMGWKYNLTELFQIDIGGDFAFADRDVYADHRPASLGGGAHNFGNIFFGFIGNVPEIQPFAYYIYDFSFVSHEFRFGFNPEFRIAALKKFKFDAAIYGAFVHVEDFAYDSDLDSRESYWYCAFKLSATYDIAENVFVRAGVGYAYNTSDGASNLPTYDCGPRKNLFSSVCVGISF